MGFDILPQITAKNTSLSNGRIERLHRTMEEYLRSHVRCDQIAYGVFHRTVAEFLRMYNTTPLRGGKSAHDKVFTFPANCDRFRPVQTRPEYDLLCKDPRETWGPGFLVDSPVLLRVMRPTNKLSRRWVPATIADRLGKKTYSLVGMPGKFDLKDLKPLADSRFGDP
ncbi:hypothetical protein Pmar_PMAR012507 [Perkinsus marinus ATCC 50983]|uniref:Integrase catalytic domain-containing protein n=1 Tax=Perkinsus marinus (strain ATCC 50983 / TXsc) TaxID=423536 RepID=C5K7J1_PERM5|nr:hypothetical protein Pmar_PMAR012507 [Perkinsus marinus ATCC 50983]EER19526.1 hypothetical protein Pmar_PMAR012507 [Perkinsus marinus ATCC 50983]|eukprot:XP_002787730.1 hypothetical protein Pmar_PMAR012507 [Perkinsus marinus ATCC 50983]